MAQAAGLAAAGLAFLPQDRELIDLFLRPKLAGQPFHAGFIHDVDVYSAAPGKLVAKLDPAPGSGGGDGRVWYFFSPVHYVGGDKNARRGGGVARKSRTVGAADGKEWWHSETGPKPVKDSATGGKFQKFSYKVKTASGVVKPGWLMVEYSVDSQEHGGADLVLCKVYRSPRAPPLSRLSSSATSVALPKSSGCKKRKAAGEHPEAPPCSVPRRTDEIVEPFETIELDVMSDDSDMLPLLPLVLDELEMRTYLFGDEPGAPPPAEPEPEEDAGATGSLVQTVDGLRTEQELMEALAMGATVDDLLGPKQGESGASGLEARRYLFTDESGAPPSEPEPEGDAAVGLDQTTAPYPDDALQVAVACLDDEEGVQLDDEPAPGEFISGLPCPPFEPAYIEALLSASGDVAMPWPAVPAAVSRLCGGDHLSSASLRTDSFGASPAVC